MGSKSGEAIAEVLYGDYNPSGKLTMSFPRNVGQVPIYYNFKNTGRPSTSIEQVTNSGYADVVNSPLYSFGYGLSYTNFKYSNLSIDNDKLDYNSKINISIDDLTLNSLRDNIALVQQEVFLFSDSILNNISLYQENILKSDIIKASKEIGVHDFIMSLPNGFDYVVGERGVTLSSGQRQLIAFLRVYIRNPKILILDEATASIDSSTEALLQNALLKLSKNRTTIVIAHRLSTIVNADKILLLDEGTILEQGNHKSLLDLKGEYFKMYENQVKN